MLVMCMWNHFHSTEAEVIRGNVFNKMDNYAARLEVTLINTTMWLHLGINYCSPIEYEALVI